MRRTSLVVVMSLLALVFVAPPANAVTDRTPVVAELVGAGEIAPGECQARADGRDVPCDEIATAGPIVTLHMQLSNARVWHRWAGSDLLQGTALVTYSWMFTETCGAASCQAKGRLWGTITWYPDAYDGGWQGRFSYPVSSLDEYGFSYSGNLEAAGFGQLEGSRLLLAAVTDGTVPEGSHTASGYALSPGNK